MTDRDRLIEAGAHIDRTLCGGGPVCESCLEYVSAVLDALTATPELAGVLARYAAEKAGRRITHGRHCICSACAAEDWTNPAFAPCGMHGSSCPREYWPMGAAGDPEPPGEGRVSE